MGEHIYLHRSWKVGFGQGPQMTNDAIFLFKWCLRTVQITSNPMVIFEFFSVNVFDGEGSLLTRRWSTEGRGEGNNRVRDSAAALPRGRCVILVGRWNKRRSLYILTTSPFFFSVHKTFNPGGPFLFSLSQTLTYATCDCDKYLWSQITVIFLGLQKENVHLSCLWIKSSLPTPPPKKKLANNGSLSVLYRFSAKSNTCAFLRVK